MNWYLKCLREYVTVSGRARRKEFWYFQLFNVLASVAIAIIDGLIGTVGTGHSVGLLGGIYSVAIFLPALFVQVRRLHDTGRSAYWLLIALIPLIGAIVLLIFSISDSEPGDNRYGPNPKSAPLSQVFV